MSKGSNRRKRYLRFSLASALMLTFLVALYFAYVAEQNRQARLAQAAILLASQHQTVEINEVSHSAPELELSAETVHIYPALRPSRIDLTYKNGTVVAGLFKLIDNEFVVVTTKSGERPTSFEDDFDGRTVVRFSQR